MTEEEKHEIVSEVLSAIRTNSAQILDLTEVETVPDDSYIELSGGKRIAASQFRDEIEDAIIEVSVSPALAAEQAARMEADTSLENSISDLVESVAGKFDKSDVVESDGSSATKVMSQRYVTSQMNSLNIRISNIKVELGTTSAGSVLLLFTKENGQAVTITLAGATTSAAGVMTAADKQKLEYLDENVSDLMELSEQHSNDLEDVIAVVFPLAVAVTSSNAGNYEKGQSVTPSAVLAITRRGVDVTEEATIVTAMAVDGNELSYEEITENTSFNITVSHKGSSVVVPQLQYRFYNYVYGDVLSSVPSDIVTAISAASTLKELSARTTYSGTLAKDKMFLFAVPGNVNLVCRHTETGALISGCITGTAMVPRVNDGETTDSYSYIIVPASDIAWNFKITNS